MSAFTARASVGRNCEAFRRTNRKVQRAGVVILAWLCLLGAPINAAETAPAIAENGVTQNRSNVAYLVTSSGRDRFTIEIADDPIERARGLMFRTEMARDHGMLFDFGNEAPRSFWMKDTPLPLDIIFFDANGKVVAIAHNTTPYSTDAIDSGAPARFVLEVNAGIARDIGLTTGDMLNQSRVPQQPD